MENLQNEQNECKEKLNAITILNQTSIDRTEKVRNETMLELETMKRNCNEIKQKIESMNSKIASLGTFTKMISESIENIETTNKKGSEEMQKVKKQMETNQIITANNNQKINWLTQK
jgi:prefoldin subunit 5